MTNNLSLIKHPGKSDIHLFPLCTYYILVELPRDSLGEKAVNLDTYSS